MDSDRTAGPDAERLYVSLERLLGRAMGIRMPAYGRFAALSPLPFASLWFAAYAVASAAVIALSERVGMPSDRRFIGLILWALGYYSAVLFLARAATLHVLDIVRRDILPYSTPGYVAAVADDLEQRFDGLASRLVPFAAAALAMVATGVAMLAENPPVSRNPLGLELIYWNFVGFYLCYVAARGVLVGRFYEPFARRLDRAQERFSVLAAAETPLVRGVARLGGQMVLFWSAIFIAILSIMLLALPLVGRYGFAAPSPFLTVVVPTAGFASLGYGSLIYLRSEAAIRATLRRFASAQAEALQSRCNALLSPAAGCLPQAADELERMSGWHDRILAGARYRNRLGTGLTLTLPFVLPLLGLVRALLGVG
jgi:hypothetical protein